MRIDSITLHNFRQYRDIVLRFPKKPCDLHVFLAEGGCGKSTLLNALEWCLYGRETHRQKATTDLKAMSRLNLSALEEMRAKGHREDEISVTIEFSNDACRYRIVRTQKVSLDPAGELFENPSTVPMFVRFDNRGKGSPFRISEELAQEEIYRFLPEDVSKFFFFDGEQLHNFFAQAPDMTKAVENISRVDLVKRCIEHLEAYTRDLRREASKNSPDLAGLEETIAKEEESLNRQRDELAKKNKDKELAEGEVKRLSGLIKGFESLQKYEQQRDQAKSELVAIEQQYNAFMIERFEITREYATLFNIFPMILKVRDYISEAKRKNQLPPPIDKGMLEQFLAKGTCAVCGRPIDGKAEQHIKDLVKLLTVGTAVSHRLSEIGVTIENFIDKVREYPAVLKKMKWQFQQLDQERKKQEVLFAEAEDYLGQCSDSEQVKKAISDREKYEHMIKRLSDDIPYYRVRIEDLQKSLDEHHAEYKSAIAKVHGLEALNRKLRFLESAIGGFITLRDDMIEEVRSSIERETNERLGLLMWKKEYGTFRLSKDYCVDVVAKTPGRDDEYSILESRSAGEFNVLALAFTLALHSCSGFESFLCIDTPVARLSPKFRERVAPIIAQIAKDSQTILLFTPSEYSSEIEAVFSKQAASIRHIDLVANEVVIGEVR